MPVGFDGGLAVELPCAPDDDWLAPLLLPLDEEPEDELPGLRLPLAPEVPELEPPVLLPELAISTPNALAVLSSMRPVTDRLLDF